jgi:hypothetical protein
MHVTHSGIKELGRVVHTDVQSSQLPQIDRSVVVGHTLYTVSSAGVAANALSNLAKAGYAAFPATPVPQPGPIPSPGPPIK